MKNRLIMMLVALILLATTIYSASALTVDEITNKGIHAGEEFEYTIITRNDTNDEINSSELDYELIENPNGMEINNEGQLTWMPLLKNHGVHTVTINVSNATHYDTETFNIEVNYNNFDITLNTNNAFTSTEAEQQYTFKLIATESEYAEAIEEYIYELEEGPSEMELVGDEIRWTPTTDQTGTHKINVSVLPKDAPNDFEKTTGIFNIEVHMPELTIDRIEVRSGSRRLETITRNNYLTSSTPYIIDRDANLGDEIELRISVKNNLPSETDFEMRDVEIELYSYDLIKADGLDAYISRIRGGRTEDQTITFLLDASDFHPDDSPFDLEIRVYGETREGEVYSDTWDLELRVESKSYDLLMSNIVMSPEPVCANERVRVSLDLRNIGTRDLTRAGIKFYASGLGIDEWNRNIELDYDESRTITQFLTIPENAIPGGYLLELTAHPRITSTSDTTIEAIAFTVRDCQSAEEQDEEEEEEEETEIVQPPIDTIVPGTPITETTGTKSTSIFDRDGTIYVVLLTALVVLLIIGVILLLVRVLN